MDPHDLKDKSPEDNRASGDLPNYQDDFKNVLALGERVLALFNDIVDLARMEALLAVKSLPRLLMLWFLMMPILLLTWCSFSAWIAWMLYAATQQPGVGFFTFFLQQLLLLFICRWLYGKYQLRMTLPYTREHIDRFIKGFDNGASGSGETKKSSDDQSRD